MGRVTFVQKFHLYLYYITCDFFTANYVYYQLYQYIQPIISYVSQRFCNVYNYPANKFVMFFL